MAFYLPDQPERGERGEDFRTLSGEVSSRENALLDTLVRDVRARQQLVRELLVEDEAKPLPFVASAKMEHGARTMAAAIRNTLEVTEEQQRAAKDAAALFTLLRAAAERAGSMCCCWAISVRITPISARTCSGASRWPTTSRPLSSSTTTTQCRRAPSRWCTSWRISGSAPAA